MAVTRSWMAGTTAGTAAGTAPAMVRVLRPKTPVRLAWLAAASLLVATGLWFVYQAKVQRMIAEGKSEQDVLAAKVTAPYDAKVPGGLLPAGAGTSADRFVSMVYAQLKAGK